MFFQVLGLTTPAYKGGVMEGDVLVSVEDTLVTLMKHAQVKIDMNECLECQMLQQLTQEIDKYFSVTQAVRLFPNC